MLNKLYYPNYWVTLISSIPKEQPEPKTGQVTKAPESKPKPDRIIVVKERVKIRCPYFGGLYNEVENKCPHCGGGRTLVRQRARQKQSYIN